MYYYTLFGLKLETDLAFPHLVECKDNKPVDVQVRKGEFSEDIQKLRGQKHYQFGERYSWLSNRTCQLQVYDGKRITYALTGEGKPKSLQNYITGWGMSMLGLQRNMIAMHCSVVASDNGAILICGESGAGKSTLTNVLLENGLKFMADDMSYVETKEDGNVVVQPAFPYQKLCRDAAMRKGYPLEELIYINEDKDKFFVPYKGDFMMHEVPVKALVMLSLSTGQEVNVTEAEGMNKFFACANNMFLRKLLKQDKYKGTVGKECFRMAQGIRVFFIERPMEGDTLEEITGKAMAIVKEVL